jgi:hypothetical protein
MSPWTEFVKMHINKCPGRTPQERMRACAAMYRKRGKGGGMRAGMVMHHRGEMKGRGVRSIMPVRQGVGLKRRAGHMRRGRSQQALAAAIHGLVHRH